MHRVGLIDVLWAIALTGMVAALIVEFWTARRWSYHRMAWVPFFAVAVIVSLVEGNLKAAGLSTLGVITSVAWARESWKAGR